MGPPELIGRVELDADAILDMVTVAEGSNSRASTPASASLTWLELTPGKADTKTTLPGSPSVSALAVPTTSIDDKIGRNPFDSLGEIALAVSATLPLPMSLSEYEKLSKDSEGGCNAQAVADAGVRVSLGVVGTPRIIARCVPKT